MLERRRELLSYVMPNTLSPTAQASAGNPYEQRFQTLLAEGLSNSVAAMQITERYIDQKPVLRGKKKLSLAEHDHAFWSSSFLTLITPADWESEIGRLALVRYLRQNRSARLDVLSYVAHEAPDALLWAVRRSRIAISAPTDRLAELETIGRLQPEVAEQCEIIAIFADAYQSRINELERSKAGLVALTPLSFLCMQACSPMRS